jgi:hypothetical protein
MEYGPVMDNWRFFQDALGLWLWQHSTSDGVVSPCSQSFRSRTDCIADAMRHGYLALKDCTNMAPTPAVDPHILIEPRTKPGESA